MSHPSKDLLFPKGFNHVVEYIKSKYGNEEDPSSCWNGARFFFHHYNIACDIDDKDAYPNESKIGDLYNWEGTYHCFCDNPTEFHHFLLIIKDDKLTLVQTYGGIPKLTIQSFNKKDWIDNFIKASNGDIKAYSYIFQIPNRFTLNFKDVTLQTLKWRK